MFILCLLHIIKWLDPYIFFSEMKMGWRPNLIAYMPLIYVRLQHQIFPLDHLIRKYGIFNLTGELIFISFLYISVQVTTVSIYMWSYLSAHIFF